MNTVQPIDWSATVAWIALAVSLAGTILAPYFIAKMNNEHQLKLRELDIKEKHEEEFSQARIKSIENYISNVSKCLSNPTHDCLRECGEHFFQIYAYAPQTLWPSLDELYELIHEHKWQQARTVFNDDVAKPLALLLKESRQ